MPGFFPIGWERSKEDKSIFAHPFNIMILLSNIVIIKLKGEACWREMQNLLQKWIYDTHPTPPVQHRFSHVGLSLPILALHVNSRNKYTVGRGCRRQAWTSLHSGTDGLRRRKLAKEMWETKRKSQLAPWSYSKSILGLWFSLWLEHKAPAVTTNLCESPRQFPHGAGPFLELSGNFATREFSSFHPLCS